MSHGNLCDTAWPGGTPELAAQTRDSGKEGRQAGLHWDTPGSTQDSLQQLSVTSSASTTPHWKGCMADIERIAYTKKKKKSNKQISSSSEGSSNTTDSLVILPKGSALLGTKKS